MHSNVWDLGRKSSIPLRSTQDDTGETMSICHPEQRAWPVVEPVGRCEASGSSMPKTGGCKAKRYILGQNHLLFNLLSISKMHFSRSKSSVTKSENSASIADKCSESSAWLCEIKISKS